MTVVEKYATLCVSVGRPGRVWLQPAEAEDAEDDTCAYAISGGYTKTLTCQDFEFAIPADAVIDEVLLVSKHGVSNPGSEHLVYDVYDGVQWHDGVGWTDTEAANWAETTFESADVTSELDTPAKVNAVVVRCRYVPSGGGGPWEMLPYTGYCDAMKIKVTYHVPAPGGILAQIM